MITALIWCITIIHLNKQGLTIKVVPKEQIKAEIIQEQHTQEKFNNAVDSYNKYNIHNPVTCPTGYACAIQLTE